MLCDVFKNCTIVLTSLTHPKHVFLLQVPHDSGVTKETSKINLVSEGGLITAGITKDTLDLLSKLKSSKQINEVSDPAIQILLENKIDTSKIEFSFRTINEVQSRYKTEHSLSKLDRNNKPFTYQIVARPYIDTFKATESNFDIEPELKKTLTKRILKSVGPSNKITVIALIGNNKYLIDLGDELGVYDSNTRGFLEQYNQDIPADPFIECGCGDSTSYVTLLDKQYTIGLEQSAIVITQTDKSRNMILKQVVNTKGNIVTYSRQVFVEIESNSQLKGVENPRMIVKELLKAKLNLKVSNLR